MQYTVAILFWYCPNIMKTFCLLPPCTSTGAKFFWDGPKFCAQPRILLMFSAGSKTFCARPKGDSNCNIQLIV